MMRSLFAIVCLLALCSITAAAQDQPISQSAPAATPAPQDKPKTIRVGGNVMQASLKKQVQPVYPADAKAAGIAGTVVLHAVIGTDGKIEDLKVVSGPPMLIKSARDAVQQWEYKPTTLSGQPMRVDTTITVVFTLGSSPSTPPSPQDQQQTGKSTEPPPIDPQFQSDLEQLLQVMHYQEKAAAGMRAMIPTIRKQIDVVFPQTPNRDKILDRFFEEVMGLANTDEFKNAMEKVYVKYLTDDDVKAMIEFYKSPAGQHYNEVSAKIIAECGQAGMVIGQSHALEIMKGLCKEYPELQGAAAFCPADSKQSGRVENPSKAASGGE